MFQLLLLLITAVIAYASDGCSFGLAVSGGILGPVWQLKNGQLRVGDYHAPAKFTINNGHLIDSKGTHCILNPKFRQLQGNEGESTLQGFSVEENGVLLYNGDPKFDACTALELEWNIYTIPVVPQFKCLVIPINADKCDVEKYLGFIRQSPIPSAHLRNGSRISSGCPSLMVRSSFYPMPVIV